MKRIDGRITIERTEQCAIVCRAWICTWAVLAVLSGCSQSNDTSVRTDKSKDAQTARTHVDRGPVKVSVEVEPHPARLSDEPTLTLTIDYQRGIKIEKPPFGEALGDFVIRDYRDPLPETKGDREIIRQIYTLEPTQTGKLQIDPITVSFTDNRSDGDGQQHSIETEALTIEVASVLDEEVPSLDDLRGIAGPVELQHQSSSAFWSVLLLLALLVLGGVVAWRVVRRRTIVEEKRLSPQELAYLELEELLQENLSSTDVKEFYVRLTGIVRNYIERTTDVHAPEQTTEEFLREISTADVFLRTEKDRLRSFLESADLVKFAAHQPTPSDVEETFERAKVFIGLENQGVAA